MTESRTARPNTSRLAVALRLAVDGVLVILVALGFPIVMLALGVPVALFVRLVVYLVRALIAAI